MFLDVETICCDKQSVALVVGTVKSTRSIDLWNGKTTAPVDAFGQAVPSDPGKSDIEVLCMMNTGLDSAGGAATIQAALVVADDEDLSVNVRVLQTSAAFTEAQAIAGKHFGLGRKLPAGITERWVGFRLINGGEIATVGKVTAAIGTGLPQLGDHSI